MTQRALAIALLILLSGCSTPGFLRSAVQWVSPDGEKLEWHSLRLQPHPNANQNSPVAIDLVLALDQIAADKLDTMTGPQWHLQRDGLMGALQGQLVVRRFELTPGDGVVIPEDSLPKERAIRVYVFASLREEVLGRLRLNPRVRQVIVEVGQSELLLRTDPPAPR